MEDGCLNVELWNMIVAGIFNGGAKKINMVNLIGKANKSWWMESVVKIKEIPMSNNQV